MIRNNSAPNLHSNRWRLAMNSFYDNRKKLKFFRSYEILNDQKIRNSIPITRVFEGPSLNQISI